jgi:hypothetical protein
MTYYLVGPATLISIVAAAAMLFLGRPAEIHMASYVVHFLPAMVAIVAIRTLAVRMWEQDPRASTFHYPGLALGVGTWPIFTLALVCAVFRVRIPHLATPKGARGGQFLPMVVPQIAAVLTLLTAVVWRTSQGLDLDSLVIVGFALLLVVQHWAVFYAVWEGWRRQQRERAAGPELILQPQANWSSPLAG